MLKIPKELISKVEEKGLIHRIPTDMGFRIEHKKGQSLVLYDDNIKLLHLAVDTMKFWTSAQAMSSDSICLLENKKVVWKFYDNYARIIVHFFEDEIDNLTNVYVWRNNHLKRNVSSLELWCNYEHFEAAEPKIETICRGVEDLKHEQIKVKQPDIIKARQFATNLENDKAVLCVYREKDNTLEMYGIHNEHITQAHTEFDKRLVKMTGRGTKATSTTTATGNKGVAEAKLTDSNKGLAKSLMSPNKPNMSIDGTGADSKDQRFATSFGNKEMAEAKSSITPNKPNRSIDGTGADSKDQRFATSFGNKEMAEAKSSITPNKPNMSMCGTDTDSKDQRFARSIGNKEMAEAKSSISPNKPNMSIDGTGPDSKDQRFAKTIANKEMAEAKSSKPPNKPNMSIGGTGADSKDQRFATSIGNKEMAEPKSSISPNKPNMSIVTTGKDSKDQSFARSIGNKAKSSISPNKPNMSIGGTGTDSKDQSFARSIGNKTMAEAQLPDLNNSSAKSEDESMADMAISSKATTKHYSQVLQIKSGSKFLYQFTLGGLKVSVYQHSIIDVKGVDAIVNAANDIMVHGGGVAYYISKAAGKEMDDEGKYFVSKNGKLRVGKNCVTGAERLPYNGIIHAVGPQWADYIGTEDRCAEDLYKTIKNTLRAAKDKKFQRIALCAISAGIYGVPKELCAEMYIKALADFSKEDVGPLSEIHFVDVNLEILGLVKDAHEKWCRSPASIDFKNALNYPSATRRRHVSNTSNLPARSHQQGMYDSSLVNFIGQFKTTFDGSPVYAFKICGAVTVKIYTGNLLRFDRVDAIVCAVNAKFKGGFAAAVAKAAGSSYQQDLLKTARRRMSISEGDIVICSAGALRVKTVMHVSVLNPVVNVNSDSLNRLKYINQRILQEANLSMIQRIGMPLIAAGLLDTKDEITACSQRFAKDVQEFCSINLTKLRLEEIHIVNQDIRRTGLLRDAFHNLENSPSGLQPVADKARSIYGRSENTTYGLDAVDIIARSIRDPSQGQASANVQEESCVIGRTAGSTKTQVSMKPLNNKGVRCTYFHSCGNNAEWSMACGHVFCSKCKPQLEGMGNCIECTGSEETESTKMTPDTGEIIETCPVCLSDFTDPVELPCSHRLCKHCLDQLKKHKPYCPICNTAFGVITGTQPKGTMKHKEIPNRLPGFQSCNAIQIIYDFPCGTQGKEHPKPGSPYKGTERHAFLPNNRQGRTVLKLLDVAFKRRLIFTIGDSRTTGKQDRVTWNDIHHKTAKAGGTENFGYPDPDYLDRVRDELAAKGVTDDCLK